MANRSVLFLMLAFSFPLLAQTTPHTGHAAPALPAADSANGPTMTLAELEQIALEHNPTLKQAEAELRIAEGRKQQAGALPNPRAGYIGEQIRGGAFNGGEHGFFVEQEVKLGGKLSAAKNVVEQERRQSQSEAEEQRLRVLYGVRSLFYETLAAQQISAVERRLAVLSSQVVKTTRQLVNAGQADETDALQAEIESQQADIALIAAQNNEERAWRMLTVTVGDPTLSRARISGSLEDGLPDLDSTPWQEKLLADSPAAKIAQAGVSRAEAKKVQARKLAIPDLRIRAGMQQNREFINATGRQTGLQGFAEAGIELPIFNRNQGNKAAAQAELERAKLESQRVDLLLRERSAPFLQSYKTSRALVERYRYEVLPRAQKVYELMRDRYQEMAGAYPQVLVAQRNWYRLQADYTAALGSAWRSAIALEGYMLTDGLEAPARSGEMDRPVRETNLPRSPGMPLQER